jgi:uncharacterized protein (TIGR03083 family)
MRPHANKELWLAGMRADAPAMRSAFERAASMPDGLSAPVPSCPGWTILDLVQHLATSYRDVRSHVSRGVTSRPEGHDRPAADTLATGAAAIQWWADEYEQLLRLLEGLDPHLPAWHWAPRTKEAGFWHRRMAHETAVHRWDAQTAVGQVEPIGARLAADGVAEVLDTLLPAGRQRGPADRSGVVHLVATDVDQEWFVRLRGAGVALLDTGTWLDHDDHQARVTARGTASDLVLALYGRVPFDLLDVTGEVPLLESVRTG